MADIKKIKIGDTTYDIVDANAARKTYSNDTPIVTPVGSIKEGATFNNVSLQDMLTMILYPYIEIEVGTATATPTVGTHYVHNLPTLTAVSIYVKKNSATNLSFELWDTTKNVKVGSTLTESNIDTNNKLTFSNLNYSIDTTRIFKIKYSYKGEDGNNSGEKTVTVGTFTVKFQNPTMKTLSSNLGSSLSYSYYNGQTASVTEITADISNLGSASATGGITKLELYKDGTKVKEASTPALPYKFTITDNLTTSTSYKVRAYYNTRPGDSTTTSSTYVDTSNLTISFSHKDASVSLTGGPSTTYFSKLNPQPISGLGAEFYEYSDQIDSIKLFLNDVQPTNGGIGSITNGWQSKGTEYNPNKGIASFDYSGTVCSTTTLTAKAYNGASIVDISDPKTLTFFAPYCYGFVDEQVSFSSVDRSTLAGLKSKKDSATALIQEKSEGYKKFIYAIPNGNYKSAKDSAGNGDENFPLFENSDNVANTKKEIEFADGSKVTYQILIFSEATGNDIDLYFRT